MSFFANHSILFKPEKQTPVAKVLAFDIDETLVHADEEGMQLDLVAALLKKFYEDNGFIVFVTHGSTFWKVNKTSKRYHLIRELCEKIGIGEESIAYLDLTHTAWYNCFSQEFTCTDNDYFDFLEHWKLEPDFFDPPFDPVPKHYEHCDANKLNLLLYGLFNFYETRFLQWIEGFEFEEKIELECTLFDDQSYQVERFSNSPMRLINMTREDSSKYSIQIRPEGCLVYDDNLFEPLDEDHQANLSIEEYSSWTVNLLRDHYLLRLAELTGIDDEIMNHLLSQKPLTEAGEKFLKYAHAAAERLHAISSTESMTSDDPEQETIFRPIDDTESPSFTNAKC